jgi:hypothetical protein
LIPRLTFASLRRRFEGETSFSGIPRLSSSRAFGAQERGSLDVKQLREAVDQFIRGYNVKAAPFAWRQGEIKQQPIRDNIAHVCM